MNDLDELENRPDEYEAGESEDIEERHDGEIFREEYTDQTRDTTDLFEVDSPSEKNVSALFTTEMTYGYEESNDISTGSIVIYLLAAVLVAALIYNIYNLIEKRKNA